MSRVNKRSGFFLNRRDFLKVAGLAGVLPAVGCSGFGKREGLGLSGSGPNIIFIFSDDLSYRDLSSYGQKMFKTPNLDYLAERSIGKLEGSGRSGRSGRSLRTE